MAFQTVIYYLGYCTALFLYKDMGRIFFVPMLLNLWFNLLITFEIYRQVDFRWLAAIHGILWLIWVFLLAREERRKIDIAMIVLLILVAFVVGTLPNLAETADAFEAMIEMSTHIWTVWYLSAFIVIIVVVIRSTVIPRYKKTFVDILTNPRKRFLIPLGICSGIIGIAPLLEGTVSSELIRHRFNIGSQVMVWGWVVLETPFFIMYERLKRKN